MLEQLKYLSCPITGTARSGQSARSSFIEHFESYRSQSKKNDDPKQIYL